MAINAGVNISKFNGYAVLGVNPGVDITKFQGYSVLGPNAGVDITKFQGYCVLGDTNVTPPLWGDWSFPDGTQYISYDYGWDMPTSAETVAYSVVVGSLPTGLSLAALSGNQAHISGVPLTLGTFNFTLRAANTFGTVDKAFSITINPIPSAAGGNFGFAA